ncbi:7503_t:CDS:2 [Ambispora gerdemannii]|uniref:7503_t:CDS:1 n=1 Tax=Ambispora gerdemannii TaxID=144530 RepID=A0A9N9BZU7_9GLOM|nr:7503_t:CDS:2 [Ambispora gerdemannii]
MSDTQSKIDSLQELNSQLIATIAELRKENAEIKAENTKLKQDKEEIEVRFVKLEQKDKEKSILITKLQHDVSLIKEQSMQDKNMECHQTAIDTLSTKDVSQSSVNSDDTLDQTVSQCKDTSISDNTSNYDVSDNAPNFDVYQDTKTQPEAKSPEDSRIEDANASKVIDKFLDEVHKKRVSDSIRQRKHEEKLQDQNSDISSVNHDVSLATSESCDIKIVPSGNDQDSSRKTICSGNDQTEISELKQDDETDKNQIVEQGLIEELCLSTENSAIDNTSSTEINISENKGNDQVLSETEVSTPPMPTKSRPPISILPSNPEEKRKHNVNMEEQSTESKH